MENANAVIAWIMLTGGFVGGIFSILAYLNNKRMGTHIYHNSQLTRDLTTALQSLQKTCDTSTTLLQKTIDLLQETYRGNQHDHDKMAKEFEILGDAIHRIGNNHDSQLRQTSPAPPDRFPTPRYR